MGDWTTIIGFAGIGVGLVGLGLLLLAIRGRLVSSAPHCRRCRFNLDGLTEPTICPECGADLAKPRSKLAGLRRGRRGVAAMAITLMLIGAVGAGLAWLPWSMAGAPTWVLTAWIRFDPDRAGLIEEIVARKLPTTELAKLVPIALRVQGDATMGWKREWGDVIEACRDAGLVSDADWRTYAVQALVVPTFSVSQRSVIGEMIGFELATGTARVGDGFRLQTSVQMRNFYVNGDLVYKAIDSQWVSGMSTQGSGSSSSTIPASGTPGPAEVTLEFDYSVLEKGQLIASATGGLQRLSAKTTLLPAGSATHALVPDPSLNEAIRAGLGLPVVELRGNGAIYLQIEFKGPPANIAARAFLRLPPELLPAGTNSTPPATGEMDRSLISIGTFSGASGKTNAFSGFGRVPNAALPVAQLVARGKVDIVIRGDLETLKRQIDFFDAWDGEIVFKDVPIKFIPNKP